jgi:hypothetical protein
LGLLVVSLWLGSSVSATAVQTLSLAWDPSADHSVSGYVVRYGSTSGAYSVALNVHTNTTATVTGLIEGVTYYFVVTAYNAAGLQSDPSNEVSFIAPGRAQMVRRAHSGTAAHIRFPVVPGQTYRVEATADLHNWVSIWQVTGTANAWVEYADVQAVAFPRRFYRILALP